MRKPIAADEKLAVTLRFLATGESYESLMYQYRINRTTIGRFVPTVCKEIYNCLQDKYFKMPMTEDQWLSIADKTFDTWQFPNAIGALDGKHISLFHPKCSGSEYYNYKGFYSLVMLALVDYDYKFLFVDVGCQGRISDGGVYNNSNLSYAIENKLLNLPEPRVLPVSNDPEWIHDQEDPKLFPFVIVADDAFPLKPEIMKPYPQRNLDDMKTLFNYRASRYRRVSENAFGILSCRFRVFLSRTNLSPENAVDIVLASVTLHNMLRNSYSPPECFDEEIDFQTIRPGSWRKEGASNVFSQLPNVRQSNRYSRNAEEIRSGFAEYFFGPGAVPWQWNLLV